MASSTYSFDIVCSPDLQEADNAINQADREIGTRYDLKGSNCTVDFDKLKRVITIKADGEHFVTAAREIIVQKMIRRGISVQALLEEPPEKLGGIHVRQTISLKNGLTKEDAKKVTIMIKDCGVKVNTQIHDDRVRVTGKSKDDLQKVVSMVRQAELGFPISIENYR